MAVEATQLDQSENYDLALRAYDEACSLLETIPTDTLESEEADRLVELVRIVHCLPYTLVDGVHRKDAGNYGVESCYTQAATCAYVVASNSTVES